MPKDFKVTAAHIKLAKRMYVGWQDCEYGAPEIDPKRPYGNSDVEGDVAQILGWKIDPDNGLTYEQGQKAAKLHGEMQFVIQYALKHLDKLV